MDLREIRHGLAFRLAQIANVAPVPFVPDAVSVGMDQVAAVIVPGEIDYWAAFTGATMRVTYTITLLTNRQDPGSAQDRLDRVLSVVGGDDPDSLVVAIRNDKTLGGAAHDCTPRRASPPRSIRVGDSNPGEYLAVDVEIEVLVGRV